MYRTMHWESKVALLKVPPIKFSPRPGLELERPRRRRKKRAIKQMLSSSSSSPGGYRTIGGGTAQQKGTNSPKRHKNIIAYSHLKKPASACVGIKQNRVSGVFICLGKNFLLACLGKESNTLRV